MAQVGFNGATAFQPWKPGRTEGAARPGQGLQWGHGLSAVETRVGRSPPATSVPASMGPRPFSRGNTVKRGVVTFPELAGFNGATAFQPWKRGGRDSQCLLHLVRASMGPRPFSRGNDSLGIVVLLVADRFNGATAFQPWKLDEKHTALSGTYQASMGPRPFSRGNVLSVPCRHPVQRSFNGATAFQPWKPEPEAGPSSQDHGQLQWGHGLSAVETPNVLNEGIEIILLQWGHGLSAVETGR